MAEYYVYALIDPRSNLPFYIGKGKGDRCKHHFLDRTKGENKFKDKVMGKIIKEGHQPEIKILHDNLEEEFAYEIEAQIIKKLGRRNQDVGGILTNICIDNRPPSALGLKRSAETRRKLSNKTLSPEHIASIRLSKLGKPRSLEIIQKIKKSKQNISQETREKIRQSRLGTTASLETKKKMSECRKGKQTGSDNPMYGKNHTLDSKNKISIATKGEKNPMYGRKHTPEAREKIRQAALKRNR